MNPQNDLTPNEAMIGAQLKMHFGHVMADARIEIAWTDPITGDLKFAMTFDPASLDDAIACAVKANRIWGQSVYFGTALRTTVAKPVGRCGAADVLHTDWLWVDLDNAGAAEAAQAQLTVMAIPNYSVVTGRHPHVRVQAFFHLDEAMHSHDDVRRALMAMAIRLGGDMKVCNIDRLMRMGGTIAYPHKKDRVAEMTEFRLLNPNLWGFDTLRGALKLDEVDLGETTRNSRAFDGIEMGPADNLGIRLKVTDGREHFMRDVVLAIFRQFVAENGRLPTARELFDLVWPQFIRAVDMTRTGHTSPEEVMRKCAYTIRRFGEGRLPWKTLDEVVADHSARSGSDRAHNGAKEQAQAQAERIVLAGDDRALNLAEDLETAATVWACTGVETWALCGGIGNADLSSIPLTRPIVVAQDADPQNSPSAQSLKKAIRRWRREGRTVLTVRPPGNDKSDWNDVIRTHGADAVSKAFSDCWKANPLPMRLPLLEAEIALQDALETSIANCLRNADERARSK